MSWLRGRLEIERFEYEIPRAVVYRLNGPLTDSRECYDLLEDVRNELRHGFRVIIFDLQAVERVTSAGIGLLAACFTAARGASGQLAIVNVPERARILLQLVHLWDVIGHHDSVDDALASLRTSPESQA